MKSFLSKLPLRWIVFLLPCVLYINTLGHEFALDDTIVISDNMYTKDGVSGWPGLLSKDTFHGFFKEEGKAELVAGGRYRPLSPMLFALIYQIVGDNPFVFHLVNILLYGLCSLLIYLFFSALCKKLRLKSPDIIAFTGTIIFAVHAVHTEVVANIKGGDEILSTIGAVACLLLLIRYQKKGDLKLLAFAVIAFFLSLLSKENTVTLLAIAPLTLWMTAGTNNIKKLIKPTLFLLGGFIVYFFIRGSVLGWTSLSNTPNELMNNPFLKYEGNSLLAFSFSEKFGTNFYCLLRYLKLLVFPHPLTHDYYPRQIPIYSLTDIAAILSVLIHGAMAVWSVIYIRKRNVLAYSILFYLIAMSITSNFVFPVGTSMSERFLFFPSIGLGLAAGYGFSKLIGKNKTLGWSVFVLIALLFSVKTITRNKTWKNNYTLFQTDVKNAPNSAKLRNAAAGSIMTRFSEMKQGAEKTKKMQEAIDHLTIALNIHPRYKNAHLLKGNAHLYKKEYDEAIQSYDIALRLDPAYKEAKNNLGIALQTAGRYYGETKSDFDKSLEYLKRAYEIDPGNVENIRLLGVAYGMKGKHAKTVEYFSKLVELQPENAEYWKLLGTAFHHNGQLEERDKVLAKAKELDPAGFNK